MTNSSNDSTLSYDPYQLDMKSLISFFIIGMVTGIAGWLLYLAVSQFFIEPVFCTNAETFAICKNGGTLAWAVAHFIVLAAATAVLARIGLYRPLLVSLSVLISLWGAHSWLGGLEWYTAVAWQGLLFGIAFMLFGLIARIPKFLYAMVAALVAILLARVVLMLS